jgi:hypothetical protein
MGDALAGDHGRVVEKHWSGLEVGEDVRHAVVGSRHEAVE